ncbi:MAG: hypothetical protein M3432_00875, partial [Chloroflexota bacterium]|nr:hypothetical protein [Chloroflexota bacterium]
MARETGETDPDATRRGPGGTPEGHTPEAPSPDEAGLKGAPAAAGVHPADVHTNERGDHASDEHAEEPLGPIDWPAWGASALGVVIALLIAAVLAIP